MNVFKNCVQELGSHRSVIGLTVVFERSYDELSDWSALPARSLLKVLQVERDG